MLFRSLRFFSDLLRSYTKDGGFRWISLLPPEVFGRMKAGTIIGTTVLMELNEWGECRCKNGDGGYI